MVQRQTSVTWVQFVQATSAVPAPGGLVVEQTRYAGDPSPRPVEPAAQASLT